LESPQLSGQATCAIVQAASADSLSHAIDVGIVERDKLRLLALVGMACEGPPRPSVALPRPVDDPNPEDP
jgi:hypothetical protein